MTTRACGKNSKNETARVGKARIVVYCAGGHASVVLDVLASQGCWAIHGLLDDRESLWGSAVGNSSVLGGRALLDTLLRRGIQRAIVAVGDNYTRRDLQFLLAAKGFEMVAARAAFSSLGSGVVVGPGSVVMGGCVINASTTLGAGVIINTSASVDHDCRVGDFAHISPGAHLGGNVSVGELTHIGIGAAILPGVSIGRESVVGAGALVRKDLPAGVIAAGVPARIIRPHINRAA